MKQKNEIRSFTDSINDNPPNLFKHGNYIWEIHPEERKAIIKHLVNHYEYRKYMEVPIGVGPYSFFFQDKFVVITSKSFLTVIEAQCESENYKININYCEMPDSPYYAILSPNNEFIIYADENNSLKSIKLNRNIDFELNVHIINCEIKERINEISFKEDCLIINENIIIPEWKEIK
jgi:hypothetical protein